MKNLFISLFFIILISKSYENTLSKFIKNLEKKSEIPNLKIPKPLNEEIKDNKQEKENGMDPPDDIIEEDIIEPEPEEEMGPIEIEDKPFCSKGRIIRGRCYCRKGMTLINDDCEYRKKKECPDGYVKKKGKCYIKYKNPTCPYGYILRGRKCVIEIEKKDHICPLGYYLKNGNCVPVDDDDDEVDDPVNEFEDEDFDCPVGFVVYKGRCVDEKKIRKY